MEKPGLIRLSGLGRRIGVSVALVAISSPFFGPGTSLANPAPSQSTGVDAVCPAASPGTAECLALLRTDIAARPESAVSPLTASPPAGYGPADIQSAYALPSAQRGRRDDGGSGRCLRSADRGGGPRGLSDEYGLPACTTANGCFRKVDEYGGTSYPGHDAGWGLEISLDLDMVSAACPNCDILLVEAASTGFSDLGTAVDTAVSLGAVAVSNSYGGPEWPSETDDDTLFYNHPGVAITVQPVLRL